METKLSIKAPEGYEPFWRHYDWLNQMIPWEFNPKYWSWKMKLYAWWRKYRGTFWVKKKPVPRTYEWRAVMRERVQVGYEGGEPQLITSTIVPNDR